MKASAYEKLAKSKAYAPPKPAPTTLNEWQNAYWTKIQSGYSPLYGADAEGTLFPDDTVQPLWNFNHLRTRLNDVVELSGSGPMPGVTTPFLYHGMFGSSFPVHIEDKDLSGLNYLHYGAPKVGNFT